VKRADPNTLVELHGKAPEQLADRIADWECSRQAAGPERGADHGVGAGDRAYGDYGGCSPGGRRRANAAADHHECVPIILCQWPNCSSSGTTFPVFKYQSNQVQKTLLV
jgi:hypothetical protein